MKICRQCQRDYEHDFPEVTSPVQELGDLFLEKETNHDVKTIVALESLIEIPGESKMGLYNPGF